MKTPISLLINQWKVGDGFSVRYYNSEYVGVVSKVNESGIWFDNNRQMFSNGNELEIISINHLNPMSINESVKNLLTPDVAALVEAGYLDSCLQRTTKCKEALEELNFEKNRKTLVEKAEKEIAEAKKAK